MSMGGVTEEITDGIQTEEDITTGVIAVTIAERKDEDFVSASAGIGADRATT